MLPDGYGQWPPWTCGPCHRPVGRQEKERYGKEMPGTKSMKDKKQLKGLQMSLLNL